MVDSKELCSGADSASDKDNTHENSGRARASLRHAKHADAAFGHTGHAGRAARGSDRTSLSQLPQHLSVRGHRRAHQRVSLNGRLPADSTQAGFAVLGAFGNSVLW